MIGVEKVLSTITWICGLYWWTISLIALISKISKVGLAGVSKKQL